MQKNIFSFFKYILVAFFLVALCTQAGQCFAASLQSDFNATYQRFWKLTKTPSQAKYRANWLLLEEDFAALFTRNTASNIAPKALYYAGRTREELAKRSFLAADYKKALDFFLRVHAHYPHHTWTDDALYRAALIQQQKLKDDAAAFALARQILQQYPNGDMRPKTLALYNALQKKLSAKPEGKTVTVAPQKQQKTVAAPAPKTQTAQKIQSAKVQKTASKSIAKTGLLRAIRYEKSDTELQVVVECSTPRDIKTMLLPASTTKTGHTRYFVDLVQTRPALSVPSQKKFNSGVLASVRMGVQPSQCTRVVLEFTRDVRPQLTTTSEPFCVRIAVPLAANTNAPKTVPHAERAQAAQNTADALALADAVVQKAPAQKATSSSKKIVAKAEAKASSKAAPKKRPAPLTQKEEAPRTIKKAPALAKSKNLVDQLGLGIRTIMLDAGHGGKDPGAVNKRFYERNYTLKMVKILGEKLQKKGFTVLYTRKSNVFLKLDERTSKANDSNADIFISIHVNASKNKRASGIETYYLDSARSDAAKRIAARENGTSERKISDLQFILADFMLNAKTKESRELASSVQKNIFTHLRKKYNYPTPNNGVRSAPFYVLMGAKMPAILIELGYCTHAYEIKRLQSDLYLTRMADGIADGIYNYKKTIEKVASR